MKVYDPSTSRRPRLLLVEDNDSLRASLVRTLGGPFEVVACADGARAAEEVEAAEFHCVLSDSGLPKLSGIDLLRHCRMRDSEVPFFLMTGEPTPELETTAIELGAAACIAKPFLMREVRDALLDAATQFLALRGAK